MIPVICIEMIYPNHDYVTRIKKVAEHGFNHVEFWGWRDKDLGAIKKVCDETGVKVVNFSAQRVGDLVDVTTHKLLLDDYTDALKGAQLLDTHTLMVLSNELGDQGVVLNSFDNLSITEKRSAVISGLKKMMEMTPASMNIVIESLNTVLDHVGYYLYSIYDGAELIQEVGDSRLKVLCDLYHQGMMGDDLIQIVNDNIDSIGYFHVADVPGRHEPGTGNVNWKEVLQNIARLGYTGYIGFEYAPQGDDDVSLQSIKSLWDSL